MSPAIRGRQARQNIEVLRELQPAATERIAARLPDPMRAVARAGITDWIALDGFVAVLDAAREEIGEASYRAWGSAAMQRALRGPLVHNLWESAVHLFGLEPLSLLGWAPHVWSLIYRQTGSIAWSQHEQALVVTGAPPLALRSMAWVESVRGGLEAVYVLCHHGAAVHIEREPGGAVRYLVEDFGLAEVAASV